MPYKHLTKKNTFFTLSSVFLFLGLLQAAPVPDLPSLQLNWPVPPEKIPRISSTFGESRMDHFHSGVDIPGEGLPIVPVKEGRVLYRTAGKPKQGELPFGGGETIVLEHDGYWSGYMHLQKINIPLSQRQVIENEQIGVSGNSGHSGGPHLHFFVYNHKNGRMYNPLPFLPNNIFTDKLPPKINSFLVQLPDKTSQVELDKSFTMSQDFPILASINDQGEKPYDKWGVYFLKVYNKEGDTLPIKEVVFDYLRFDKGRWVTSNFLTFEDTYFLNYYVLGNRFRDSKTLIIKAGGLSGPQFQKNYRLNIKE